MPAPGFKGSSLAVGDRKACADRVSGELIDRVAAGTPIGELLLVQPLRHMRMPLSDDRPVHRTGIEPAAIDAHGAAEAASDVKGGLDDGVAGKSRRDRLEVGDFPGRAAAGHFRILLGVSGARYYDMNGSGSMGIAGREPGELIRSANAKREAAVASKVCQRRHPGVRDRHPMGGDARLNSGKGKGSGVISRSSGRSRQEPGPSVARDTLKVIYWILFRWRTTRRKTASIISKASGGS
jgi:hypothetical protein